MVHRLGAQRLTDLTFQTAQARLGLTRAELAAALGVDYDTLSKWERGERTPPAVAASHLRLLGWLHGKRLLNPWLLICRVKRNPPCSSSKTEAKPSPAPTTGAATTPATATSTSPGTPEPPDSSCPMPPRPSSET
ncbi:hypothetical protein CKO27_16460 [Thiocystis violacea]|nr:hypothetical protein [Thiocystis violacea]